MTPEENPLMEAALDYARRGWPVFPCEPNRKVPVGRLAPHGVHSATTDAETIRAWWGAESRANVAIAMGAASGLFVVDVDPRNGGDQTLADLESAHGSLPAMLRARTGGGGEHLFFRLLPGMKVRSGNHRLGPGLDVKADGGYVIASPSYVVVPGEATKPGYEGPYAWANVSEPVAAPSWMLTLAAPPPPAPPSTHEPSGAAPVARARAYLAMMDPAISGSGGHAATWRAAVAMVRGFSLSPGDAFDLLWCDYNPRCKPPWSERDLHHKVDSATRANLPDGYLLDDPGRAWTAPMHVQPTMDEDIMTKANDTDTASANEASTPDASWPDPMAPEAYYGLAGDIVRAIEPHTEADPAALLVQLLTAFGNAIGSGPHFMVEDTRHGFNLFVAMVGDTSKGRKGTSWNRIKTVFFRSGLEDWRKRIVSGLSSGEGLIWHVRDPIEEENEEGEPEVTDRGVKDKRLLVMESELASPIARMQRDGNSLSAVIREAWDSGTLRVMTKNSPAQATGAHVSIIGHVTGEELRRTMNATELANGFANRFLWICAKRARVLPFGGGVVNMNEHVAAIHGAIEFATSSDEIEITWAPDARPIWEEHYAKLSRGRPGILGAVTGRAEAQVTRLACLYALLDCERKIQPVHLFAALALWRYAFASARWIWGDALGDPVADDLLRLLRAAGPEGMTRTQIRDAFGRHRSADDVGHAIGVLVQHGLARVEVRKTKGRPEERVVATATKATKATEGG